MTVTTALFAVVSTLLFALLHDGFVKFRMVNAKFDTQQRLSRAINWLQKDLEKANAAQLGLKRVSGSGNGDMIWFLSADDPTQTSPDLSFVRDPATGLPNYQRTILYYLIRPGNYAKVSQGYVPGVDPDPRNDYYAPHKFLIRKVINDPSTPESLMDAATADSYVTAPADYNLSTLSAEARVDSCRLIADGLLSFEATLYDRTIELDLRAVDYKSAEHELPMGSVSLKDTKYTQHQRIRVVMKQ